MFRISIQVLGMGHELPAKILNNYDLEQIVDTSDKWIVERTGISERRISDLNISTSDLCIKAAEIALERSGIQAEELDLIIVATVTPDMIVPSTACLVQKGLKAWKAAAFDLEAGCTGFVYALTVAEKFLLTPDYKYALVIGAETLSRIVDYTDRNTCVLFGDGAGAAILGKGEKGPGILSTYLGADGGQNEHLLVPAGGSAMPANHETVEKRLHYVKMNGKEVFKFATRIMVEVSNKLMAMAGMNYQEVDVFVPHQANLRIIKTAMKRMNIPVSKTIINLDRLGNMSAASIPVALSEAESEGKIKNGDLILTVGFGAGLTYGGALIRWGRD